MATPKKRLVHIISSLAQGGAERLLVLLIEELVEFEHSVFYFHDGPLRQELAHYGIPTFYVQGLVRPYDPLGCYRLIREVRKLNPFCIHTSLWAANCIGALLHSITGIPVISAVHALCEHEGTVRTILGRWLPAKPSRFIAVCQAVANSLVQHRKIQSQDITVIFNGIRVENTSSPEKISGPKPKQFIFGSVGRFVPVKNYPILLESFCHLAKRHESVHLMLVGGGSEEAALRSLAQKLGIEERVTFVVNQAAHAYYPFFDCFVQPSRYEGLSLALLEALSFKLPAIVTGYGFQHEVIVNNENGLVVEPSSVNDLTQALEKIFVDMVVREKLKEKGYQTILEKFTIQRAAQGYRKVIDQVCGL